MATNTNTNQPQISKSQHLQYLRQTIELAQKSPKKPTNFRVGCVLVSYPLISTTTNTSSSTPQIISTGYTLELPGNTHAEQNALSKLIHSNSGTEEEILAEILTPQANIILYTSLEPCGKRLSGNTPCVQRIISTTLPHTNTSNNERKGGIQKVIFGAKEPGTFVQNSTSCKLLSEAGIEWEYISDFEGEILRVAMEGHHVEDSNSKDVNKDGDGNIETDRTEEGGEGRKGNTKGEEGDKKEEETVLVEREEEQQPRNRKKRMMEAPPQPEG